MLSKLTGISKINTSSDRIYTTRVYKQMEVEDSDDENVDAGHVQECINKGVAGGLVVKALDSSRKVASSSPISSRRIFRFMVV